MNQSNTMPEFQTQTQLVLLKVHKSVSNFCQTITAPFRRLLEPTSTAMFQRELNRKELVLVDLKDIKDVVDDRPTDPDIFTRETPIPSGEDK